MAKILQGNPSNRRSTLSELASVRGVLSETEDEALRSLPGHTANAI